MMTEQQMIFKSDGFQDKWRKCINTTLYVYRFSELVKDCVHRLMEALNDFFSNLKDTFRKFQLVIEKTVSIEPRQTFNRIYPHKYPHYVDRNRYNSKGFQRPIMRCARSRC